MNIITRTVGALSVNCYIVHCKKTLAAVVIDPGGNAADIIADIHWHSLKVVGVINTHGHADHIMDNTKLRDATQAPLYIHEADAVMLADAELNLSDYLGEAITCRPAEKNLRDGDVIVVGDLRLTVIHTPGHTPGGICLHSGQVLFSGDTLFAESVGRTDFPGGSHSQLIDSITNKLFTLDGDTKVYPGHGSATTIDWEKQRNPFI